MAKSMWEIIAKANGKKTGDELVAENEARQRAELEVIMKHMNAKRARAYLKMKIRLENEDSA